VVQVKQKEKTSIYRFTDGSTVGGLKKPFLSGGLSFCNWLQLDSFSFSQ
jgi:hypothetical protein